MLVWMVSRSSFFTSQQCDICGVRSLIPWHCEWPLGTIPLCMAEKPQGSLTVPRSFLGSEKRVCIDRTTNEIKNDSTDNQRIVLHHTYGADDLNFCKKRREETNTFLQDYDVHPPKKLLPMSEAWPFWQCNEWAALLSFVKQECIGQFFEYVYN